MAAVSDPGVTVEEGIGSVHAAKKNVNDTAKIENFEIKLSPPLEALY